MQGTVFYVFRPDGNAWIFRATSLLCLFMFLTAIPLAWTSYYLVALWCLTLPVLPFALTGLFTKRFFPRKGALKVIVEVGFWVLSIMSAYTFLAFFCG
jgi:hypothetical protein